MNTNNDKDQKSTFYLPHLERIRSIRNGARRESDGEADAEVGIGYSDLLDVLDAAEVAHKMREAIKEAHAALRMFADEYLWRSEPLTPLSANYTQRIFEVQIAALAKLQPFTK